MTPLQLSDAQTTAIKHPGARLQVLACAGSGKTEVLAQRTVHLLESGVDPATIIAFTFTEKAAAELRARIESRAAAAIPSYADLPPGSRGMYVGTSHGWALNALRSLGGKYETLDGLGDGAEWALLYRVARRLGVVDLLRTLPQPPAKAYTALAIETFLRSVEVVYNDNIDRGVLHHRAPAFAATLDRYERLLDQMRLLPFRLMIARAIEELRDGGLLRQALDGRVAHVLVDEFQDFNPAQDALVQAFARMGAELTVVADDDQAIYQWRGGDVSLFVRFNERYAGTEQSPLEANHRCRPEIVDFARHVVEPLGDERLPKVLAGARDAAVGPAIEMGGMTNAAEEAAHVATRIEQLIQAGHQPRDIAVLYRSVRTSAPPLVTALRATDIQHTVVGKTSLLARPEMALIARVFVYWAGGTWYPSTNREPEVVSLATLATDIAQVTGAQGPALKHCLERLDRLGSLVREHGVDDSVDVFNQILVVLGIPDNPSVRTREERGFGQMSEMLVEFDQAVRRAAPRELYETRDQAAEAEAQDDTLLAADRLDDAPAKPMSNTIVGSTRGDVYLRRLRAFLEQFAGRAAEEGSDELADELNAVQIMTIHQAKGLEFPIVFLPSLVEGRFPSVMMGRRQSWYVPADLFDPGRYEGREPDEARLFYVALTRAKELVILTWFKATEKRAAQPSRFLKGPLKAEPTLPGPFGSGRPIVSAPKSAAESGILETDFSTLTLYASCGRRYWLREVCGFQPPRVPELGFGRLIHHVLAELARRARVGTQLDAALASSLLDEAFYLPFASAIPATNLKASARRRVLRYLDQFGGELVRTREPEAAFEVPLANARIRGRIDLLLNADSGRTREVEIVDFKTSESAVVDPMHENQLRLYAAAMRRTGLEPVRISIHDLGGKPGGRIDVPMDDTAARAFERDLEGWVAGINEHRFEPTRDQGDCASCDYRRICRDAPAATRTARAPGRLEV
jgi:DNA helicase-2/ATP-dependent DNA helicase PcrA